MITWPVVLERQDELHGTGIEMNTTASLYQDGRIEASVHIWEITLLTGGHGSVTLLAYDAGGHRIWSSDPERWGVDGRAIGTWDRWGAVKGQLDADTLKEVASIGIYHAPAPNDVWDNIQRWLAGTVTLTSELAKIVTNVSNIINTISGSSTNPTASTTSGDGQTRAKGSQA